MQMNPRVRAPPAIPPARCPVRPPPTQSLGPDSGASREQEGWGRCTWSLEVKSRNFFFFFSFFFCSPFFCAGCCCCCCLKWRKQDRRRLGKKKWSRNGKIRTHPRQMVSRCKLRCFRGPFPARAHSRPRAPPAHTLTRAHARTHTHSRARAGPRAQRAAATQ